MTAGRPHEPTRESRRLVEHHAATGTTHQQIAKLIGLSANSLKKHYPEELELGLARANAVVSGSLFTAAKSGNITACIFWLKTRAGWRETNRVEHSGTTAVEVRQVDASKLSDATLNELMGARGHAADGE